MDHIILPTIPPILAPLDLAKRPAWWFEQISLQDSSPLEAEFDTCDLTSECLKFSVFVTSCVMLQYNFI